MSRAPRFVPIDIPQHVIQRGNNREVMFARPADYQFYLACLGYAARRNAVRIHAYVLMSNHVHFLATPGPPTSLARTMQSVGCTYVKYYNAQWGRSGTLWEGRYRSTAVTNEAYFLKCMRYIELNPVRAAMVARPEDYTWSSYAANARGGHDVIVHGHALYHQLGATPAQRCDAYRALFREVLTDADLDIIRNSSRGKWPIEASRSDMASLEFEQGD